ncbi:hypothetical protein KY320_02400 [Candidatus Woesearchaeota archaeon]|nr:hypothetical protein [Candidatus Woesearchaeota archaeon]
MVTVAHLTKKILAERPFILDALDKELINVGALADYIKPEIEKELKTKVKSSAISMAIRRYVEQGLRNIKVIKLSSRADVLVKSNLFAISIVKSPSVYKKLMSLYGVVDFEQGDTLNIIQGNYEILILVNDKYSKRFLEILKGETVKAKRDKISSISIKIPSECLENPGFYFTITKILAMENIPIYELVNTETEATFILADKDIARAYELLRKEIIVQYYEK